MYRGRDLANYVHIDELFQAYLNACLLMITPNARGGLQVPPNPGNPYPGSNQSGFGTLGEPNFKTLVAEVATRALKAVWYQKWFVHRRMRPETYAGRIHHQLAGTAGAAYPFDAGEFAKLNATLLPAVKAANAAVFVGGASWMLPMAFPEGSPTHPAYGAGHATVAGACVTVLKALFDTEQPIGPLVAKAQAYGGGTLTLVEPDATGTVLNPYTETGPNKLTVRGELEKLASNIGIARNFAGVHWRSDYTESLYLGERVALEFLRDTAATYNEDVSFTFRLFNGSGVTITKDAAVRGPVPA
jgi:membrane-associated phospholipid phosphatase